MTNPEATRSELAEVNISTLQVGAKSSLVAESEAKIGPILDEIGARQGFRGLLAPKDRPTGLDLDPKRRYAFRITVWASPAQLFGFMRNKQNLALLREYKRKNLYVIPPPLPSMAFWWVDTGHMPDIQEGADRLVILRKNQGESSEEVMNLWTAKQLSDI